MHNTKIVIEYDGTNYCGWQIQNHRSSFLPAGRHGVVRGSKKAIQETIEKALQKILQEKIKVTGSGRTDSGVHAQAQVANFKSKTKFNALKMQSALNGILPADVRIKKVQEVTQDFHARFSAKSKLYRYSIINAFFAPVFLKDYTCLVRHPLNLRKMRQAAKLLLGKHDFRSFQAKDKKERHSVRKVMRLDIRKKNNCIYINIQADGFLYKMVRNIVGTLIEVGRGKLEYQDITAILKAEDRTCAGPCASAKGLCLMEVKY